MLVAAPFVGLLVHLLLWAKLHVALVLPVLLRARDCQLLRPMHSSVEPPSLVLWIRVVHLGLESRLTEMSFSGRVAPASNQGLCQSLTGGDACALGAKSSQSGAWQHEKWRSRYLRRMKGLCFNCLARDHKVGSCSSPKRCWQCRCYGHISTVCPSRRSGSLECASALMHTSSIGGQVVDDSLLQFKCTPLFVAHEKSLDPMVLEAHLMMRLCDVGEGSSTLQPATPSPVANHCHTKEKMRHIQPNVEDVQTPSIVRCEEEQLIGHELIKALSHLKHTMATPLSPFILQNSSPKKVSIGVQQEVGMHCNRRRKLKPDVKVVRNMLTKKWIVVKKDKQLVDKKLIALARLLKALRRLL